MSESTRDHLEAFLAAIASRDLRRIEDLLDPEAQWRNMPHPPAVGRRGVMEMLAAIITWSDEVRWDVVSAAVDGDTAWVERVDRFVIAGHEHAVECHGVFVFSRGMLREVRDYVDLGEWRARVSSVLGALGTRSPVEVVRRHLDGVASGQVAAMAADYALDAVLVRPDGERHGWRAIADYFDTVPERLGDGVVVFDGVETEGDTGANVPWRIERAGQTIAAGTDTYTVVEGRIRRQVVALTSSDF